MGTAESKNKSPSRQPKEKQIKKTENSNQPIKSQKERKSDRKKKKQSQSPKKSPEKSNSETKTSSNPNSKDKKDKPSQANREQSETSRNGDVKQTKPHDDKKNETKPAKIERSNSKRLSFRKRKERIEKEKRMQRVPKDQLRKLAGNLQRTSWYLGRRLGMDNLQATRYQTGFVTEEERKYQMLLWWRRVHGWKATSQRLVILLELGNYTEDEYTVILTSSNGDVTIYDKAPDIQTETKEPNDKRELYHSDVTKSPGGSYGNETYGNTVQARVHEKNTQKSQAGKKKSRNKEQEKRKSRSRENLDSTLPPWWNKSLDNLNQPVRGRNTNTRQEESKGRKDKKKSNHRKSKSRENLATPDGNTSQTDDSGIVTSPPTSPAGIKTIEVAADAENVKPLKHTVEPPAIQTDQSQSVQDASHYETIHPSQSQPEQSHAPASTSPAPNSLKREPNRSSNTLIVRRCSDSVVKLRYSSLPNRRPRHQEPPIKEQHEDQQSTRNTSNYEITINEDDVTNNITKHRHSNSRNSTSKPNQNERVSKTNRDVRTSSEDAAKGDDDVTNPAGTKDIKSMISKYETLSKVNEGKKRESMAESIARYNEWNTLERNGDRSRPTSSHYASRTSLNSAGSHLSGGRGSVASSYNPRHSRSRFSQPMQRFHYFTFGGKGRFPSRFKGLISGLAIFGDSDIVASDGENKRVQIFDKNGRFQTTFDTGTEFKPKGLCITPDGRIAVCCGDSVNVYDRDGTRHLSFGQGVFQNNCYCVCCDKDNNYYVTDIVTHTVSIHDAQGRIRKRFGFEGTSMIHFNQPVALAINSKNKLFITDSQNHCIKVYKLSGRPLYRIGAQGSADGLFWNPLGICIDHEDNLYVADCGNNRISLFNPDSQFLRHLLTEEDGISMPSLVQINKHGQLIICEWEKQIIKIFTIETTL